MCHSPGGPRLGGPGSDPGDREAEAGAVGAPRPRALPRPPPHRAHRARPEGKVQREPVNNSAGRALAARGSGKSPLPAAEATSRKRGRHRPPPR